MDYMKRLRETFDEKFGCIKEQKMLETLPPEYRDGLFFDYSCIDFEKPYSITDILGGGSSSSDAFTLREFAIPYMGFGVITHEFCLALSNYINKGKVLEIMAGNGLLTYGLREYGVQSHAIDDFSWHKPMTPWINDVEDMDAVKAIEKYAKDVDYLVVSWPPMDTDIEEVLIKLAKVNKNLPIIYIGECAGGCTATEGFWELVEEVDDPDFNSVVASYHSWYGIHDTPYLLRLI